MKYFFGFAAVILVLLVTFVLIWRGWSGNTTPEAPPPLSDYTYTTAAMRLTTIGPVNPDQEHRAVRITISRSENRLEVLEGYQRSPASSKSYPSNQEAYGTFLRALDLMGYTKGNDNPNLADDRGFCPTGKRFIYEIVDGTNVKQRYWSTSCSKAQGTFNGAASAIQKLFKDQIPEYRDLTRGVKL